MKPPTEATVISMTKTATIVLQSRTTPLARSPENHQMIYCGCAFAEECVLQNV